MSGKIAAQIARDAATGQNGDFYQLSALMCWDAVALCLEKGGGGATASITTASFDHFISTGNPQVTSGAEMRFVPQGAVIGFFDSGRLIHAMIATGHGLAAGNKNACIGIGNPVGWEILDLANRLEWANGGVVNGGRKLTVHYRDT